MFMCTQKKSVSKWIIGSIRLKDLHIQ